MSGISVLHLVLQAGPVAKGVLLLLLFFSIASWAIIIAKLRTLRKAERQSDGFLHLFRTSKNLSAAYEEAKRYPASPVVGLFREGFRELSQHGRGNPHPGGNPGGLPLTPPAERGGETPFIGLVGPVWGIIDAFVGIGAAGSANLGAVAPGIAEALIATAAGLAAALPAVIAYNYFVNRIRGIGTRLDLFTLEFMGLAERLVGGRGGRPLPDRRHGGCV